MDINKLVLDVDKMGEAVKDILPDVAGYCFECSICIGEVGGVKVYIVAKNDDDSQEDEVSEMWNCII